VTKLPTGWTHATGADVFTFVTSGSRGWAQYYSNSGAWFIRIGNLDHGTLSLDLTDVQCVHPPSGVEGERTRLRPNDILISITADLGMIGLVPSTIGEAYINQHIALTRPSSLVDARFIAWYLVSDADGKRQLREMRRGATKAGLGLDDIRRLYFPLAPFHEQQRISNKLDALLARVRACRERLNRVPVILDRLRQAILTTAMSGELTKEWREERAKDRTTPGWTTVTLETLCEPSRAITYGVIKLGEETEGGVPCLRTSNVRWLKIDTEGMKRIDPTLSAEFARTVLRGGEVLVNVRGTLGGVAVAMPEMRGWNVSREVAVVPLDHSKIDPTFLSFWIGSARSQRWLELVEKGIAYTGINIEDLRALPVSVPSLEEQREIVRRIQLLLANTDAIDARCGNTVDFVARLTPSILAKAFRGEIVPQDPHDEPASKLLGRLKRERAANHDGVTPAAAGAHRGSARRWPDGCRHPG